MSVSVTKADGTRQLFDREKVVRTCLRMGASREIAEGVATKVEARTYDGIETGKILQLIFRLLSKHKPAIRHLIDLRKALSTMASRPDFERFVQIVLGENGYEIAPNRLARGKCVEHEADAIARKDGVTYFVEIKHHRNFHTPTGLDESRIARAIIEDVTEGYELGLNDLEVSKAMIVCNTKFSEHAKRYGECRGVLQMGWSAPPYRSLQDLIEEKRLYPVTCLKGLDVATKERMASAGILLLRQLVERSLEELAKQTGIPEETLEPVVRKARIAFSSLETTPRRASDLSVG